MMTLQKFFGFLIKYPIHSLFLLKKGFLLKNLKHNKGY